jgi:Type II secretion system (T2SS), protein M
MQLSVRQLMSLRPAAILWSRVKSACAPYIDRVRGVLTPYWGSAAQWYEKREPREKLLLRLLGGVLALLFIYNAAYVPARNWHDALAERVAARHHQIIRLRGMMRNYERLRLELASTQKRTVPGGKDPALFSVLEMTLTNSVGRAKIGSITPGEHQVSGGFEQYTVAVKLNEIALAQIVDTLYSLQSLSVPITISNFQIRQHARDSHTFDVDLTCMALGKPG